MATSFFEKTTIIASYLDKLGYDGWLLYSFHGSNAIAEDLVSVHNATRRWYCLLRQDGSYVFLVHELEKSIFAFPAECMMYYTSASDLMVKLLILLQGVKKVCMEYSPMNAIPYVSKIDAGTIELIQSFGIIISSSVELVQRLGASWGGEKGFDAHKQAILILQDSIVSAIEYIKKSINTLGYADEYETQQHIHEYFASYGLETNHPIIVATAPNNASPHYFPTIEKSSKIYPNSLVLFDVRGKLAHNSDAIYGDITHMYYFGSDIPEEVLAVWNVIRHARDIGVKLISESCMAGNKIEGREVDDAVRNYIIDKGYGSYFTHRTGHSIQKDLHSVGVNIDNFELHDTRAIISDCGFSIEPGIYLPNQFGIRSEIDCYISSDYKLVIACDIQHDLSCIKL